MIHTDSVAEVQDEGKRLANNRNLLEKFSICPVYTGMSLIGGGAPNLKHYLPRIHGDEPNIVKWCLGAPESAPYTRGWSLS